MPSHEYIDAPVGFCSADRSSCTAPLVPPSAVVPLGPVAVGPVSVGPVGEVPPSWTCGSPLEHAANSRIANTGAAARARARRTAVSYTAGREGSTPPEGRFVTPAD